MGLTDLTRTRRIFIASPGREAVRPRRSAELCFSRCEAHRRALSSWFQVCLSFKLRVPVSSPASLSGSLHCVRQHLAIAEATAERGGEEGGVELAGRSLLRDSEELDKNKYVYLHDGISFLKVLTMLETGPDGAKS